MFPHSGKTTVLSIKNSLAVVLNNAEASEKLIEPLETIFEYKDCNSNKVVDVVI